MPPSIRITREAIISGAVDLVREQGIEGLTTRTLAKKLNCSTQPIFSNFPNMESLKQLVLEKAYELYVDRTFRSMGSGEYPPYKASGMAYIEFAVEEPQLFRLLYMRDRHNEERINDTPESERIVEVIIRNTGVTLAQAHRLHEELWVLVHGLATMYATGFEVYDREKASRMLSDVYLGILCRIKNERKEHDDGGNQAEGIDQTL